MFHLRPYKLMIVLLPLCLNASPLSSLSEEEIISISPSSPLTNTGSPESFPDDKLKVAITLPPQTRNAAAPTLVKPFLKQSDILIPIDLLITAANFATFAFTDRKEGAWGMLITTSILLPVRTAHWHTFRANSDRQDWIYIDLKSNIGQNFLAWLSALVAVGCAYGYPLPFQYVYYIASALQGVSLGADLYALGWQFHYRWKHRPAQPQNA